MKTLTRVTAAILFALMGLAARAEGPVVPLPKLYVCNNEGTEVMVVDLRTHQVVNFIDVGGQPHGLTVTAKGDRAYISSSGPNDVVAVDTATDEILWRADVGPRPHMLSVTPDGRFVYVCIFGDVDVRGVSLFNVNHPIVDTREVIATLKPANLTDVIDTQKRRRIKTIETGYGPHVSYAPNNRHVYMTAWFDKHVSVIGTKNHEVVRTIPCPGMVRPIVIDKAERWMYAALSGLHGFVVADLEKGRVVEVIQNPPYPDNAEAPEYNAPTHGLAIRPGEKELYVTSQIDHKIYVYSLPDCILQAAIETGRQPNWITFTPDGARAYVSNATDDTVSAIDTESRKVIATIPVGRSPKRLAVVGDTTR